MQYSLFIQNVLCYAVLCYAAQCAVLCYAVQWLYVRTYQLLPFNKFIDAILYCIFPLYFTLSLSMTLSSCFFPSITATITIITSIIICLTISATSLHAIRFATIQVKLTNQPSSYNEWNVSVSLRQSVDFWTNLWMLMMKKNKAQQNKTISQPAIQ